MQPLSSAITGALAAATQQEQTGQRPGETGSGKSQTAVVAWLELRAPDQTDRELLRSLASSLNVEVILETANRFPENKPVYSEIVSCKLNGLRVENRNAVQAKIQNACTQAPRSKLEDWLVALQAATARRGDDETAMSVALDIYSGALGRYPADVAKAACMNLALRPESPNWWPTLGELDAECQRLAKPRLAMMHAIQNWIAPSPEKAQAKGDEARARDLRVQAEELRRAAGPGEYTGHRREAHEQADSLDRQARELEMRARKAGPR